MIDGKIKQFNFVISEDPTAEELENLKEARKRILLVIKARWVILGAFLLYGLIAAFLYSTDKSLDVSLSHKIILVAAFLIVACCNAWYHYTYKWFPKFRHLNLIQILVDLGFVTLIVHYSGGAVSWFWAIYLLLIVEAAFMGERVYGLWLIGIGASLIYGALLTAEFYGVIQPVKMPFENISLQQNFQYEIIKWAWVSVVCLLFSGIGSYLMKARKRQDDIHRKMAISDKLTGLYNRWYFDVRLNSELQRAKRYGRIFSLAIIDVDDFKRFNDTYGYQMGDFLLQGVADMIKKNIRRNDVTPKYDVDVPFRVGGEEFAVILPEASSVVCTNAAERLRASIESRGAAVVGERIRSGIESHEVGEKEVTVSVGIASFPDHGTDIITLVKAAEGAVYLAKQRGKNRVVIASTESL